MDASEQKRILARLRKLVERGVTLREAGRQTGVSAATACRLLQPLRIKRRRKKPRLSEDERQRIDQLVEARKSLRAIARLLKRSTSTVIYHVGDTRAVRQKRPFRKTNRRRRCPQCGATIETATCVACAVACAVKHRARE